MADISKITVDNVNYDIKDASAPLRQFSNYSKTGTLPITSSDNTQTAIGKLENAVNTNQTNILSTQNMICDTEFSTSTAYAVGDYVTYNNSLYVFTSAHSAGNWNSSEVSEVSVVDLISSGSGADSIASKEIYVTKPINQPDTWETKTWSGLTSFYGQAIWSDGTDIYYSNGSNQYVLNKSTSTWSTKSWSGLTSFEGIYVWSDGTDIYYSYGSTQYVLDKATSTWSTKTWSGLASFSGLCVWSDGTDIYYSLGSNQYVLNKETSTWETKTWSGLTSFTGNQIWTDGDNIYCPDGSPESRQYVLDKATSTWETKTWDGLTDLYGQGIWSDGTDIYYSSGSNQYVLNKSTSRWSTKSWTGLTSFNGERVWSDGENIYYSYESTHYVLKRPLKTTKIPDVKNNAQLTALIGDINSVLEAVL